MLSVTYPRCSVTPENALPQLLEALPDLADYAIAVENHADGGLHLHAFLRASEGKHLLVTHCRQLDLDDGSKIYHPNQESARQPDAWLSYVGKEGRLFTNMRRSELERMMDTARARLLKTMAACKKQKMKKVLILMSFLTGFRNAIAPGNFCAHILRVLRS